MIEIKDLKKSLRCNGSEKTLFHDFNLEIVKGEKVGLFSPNGTGKTTLMNILAGIDKEYAGTVSNTGKRIGYVYQDPQATLAPWFTCEENILLVRKYHRLDVEKGRALLKQLVKPLNLNFSLSAYPFMLSGGQRQIVTLLRGLIIEPDVLLMDEPFSALDIGKRAAVVEFLKTRFTENVTVIMSSHRGEEVKTLLGRAVVLEYQSATRIRADICMSTPCSLQNFEQAVSELGCRRYAYDV
jgi:ABC-type nitrate/sulfonate/bicarbonate transport system ATPase subunit